MATEWKPFKLSQVTTFSTGKLDSNAAVESGKYPFFTCSPTTLAIDHFAFDTEAVILAGNNANGIFPVKYYNGKFNAYQRTYIIEPKNRNNLNCRFLYYLISHVIGEFRELSIGSATKFLTKQIFDAFEVTLPSFDEQEQLAIILAELDDKIELNRRMNATLEAMAQALFKSWFVDFDPVKAKAAGRAPEGMDADTAALFPSELVESELGLIPQGWKPSTVGENFFLTMGQSPPGETYNESGEGLSFFQGRTDFGFRYPTARVFCTAPTRLAEKDDTLVSVRAPVGDVNLALEKCCIGRGVAAIRHRSKSRSYTFYSMLELENHFSHFEAQGTVFGSINKSDFQALRIVNPSPDIVSAFEQIASSFDSNIELATCEIESLTKLRDTLLPKLISGQLRIPEVGAVME